MLLLFLIFFASMKLLTCSLTLASTEKTQWVYLLKLGLGKQNLALELYSTRRLGSGLDIGWVHQMVQQGWGDPCSREGSKHKGTRTNASFEKLASLQHLLCLIAHLNPSSYHMVLWEQVCNSSHICFNCLWLSSPFGICTKGGYKSFYGSKIL